MHQPNILLLKLVLIMRIHYKGQKIRIGKIFSYFQEFENLYLIGRNADFEYLHTHHIIDRSEKLVNRMVS